MSTRMLTVAIDDTPGQTRAVLHAHASDVNGPRAGLDVSALVAAQRWLALAGVREVAIPYAHVLADAVPVALVRMRRDFRQLLTVIETSAFLHQRQRARDEHGRVVATLDDYAIARRLLLDTFTAAATGGLSAAVRETARAVRELCVNAPEGVRNIDVAKRLGLHASTASRRLRDAIRVGLVVNRETRRRQPALLVPGEADADDREVLPSVEALRVLVSHPESDAIVQSDPAGARPDGAEADCTSDCTPLQSDMQSLGPAADAPTDAPIARLHDLPGETDTHRDEADPDGGQWIEI